MNSVAVKKDGTAKLNSTLKFLSIISLFCAVLTSILSFIGIDSSSISNETDFRFVFSDPDLRQLIGLILYLAPVIILSLFSFNHFKKTKTATLLSIVVGLISLGVLYDSIFGWRTVDAFFGILVFCILSSSILSIIALQKSLKSSLFILIAIALCWLRSTIFYIGSLADIEWIMHFNIGRLSIFINLVDFIGLCMLYVAVLLFVKTSQNSSAASILAEEKSGITNNLPPEQALSLLNTKLALGTISEEEYCAQRERIINNL